MTETTNDGQPRKVHGRPEVRPVEILGGRQVFGMFAGTEAKAKLDPIRESIQKLFPSSEYFTYLLGSKVESGVSDNPYGVLETTLGGVQRAVNLGQKIPHILQEEKTPAIVKELVLERGEQAVNLGSIESGVIPTYGSYDSVIVLKMRGKLTPDKIDVQSNTVQFPQDVSIISISPHTQEETTLSQDQTPFASRDLAIRPGDDQASYPDRAVGVLYDPKTDTTLIGISRGVPFDPRDVQRTKELNDAGGKYRVADIMAERLVREGKLQKIGDAYHVVRDSIATDELFDVQNPQRYIDSDFPREKQIGEMTDMLLAKVKENWGTP